MKKKKNKNELCYMCDSVATSREHVPPVCLFPEEKDIKTSIFRNNLITVPSCEIHNSKKSKDDEFLMASLAGVVGNNAIGYFHTQTKIKRALERKDKDFFNAILKNPEKQEFQNQKGERFPVLIGQPDVTRMTKCFNHIAYGLYFHKFKKRFKGKIHSILDFVTYEDELTEKYKLLVRTRVAFEPNKPKSEGSSQEIFKYEFFDADERGLIGIQLCFYEGAKVFMAFQQDGIDLSDDLTSKLIKSGIKTIIQFDDKTRIEFN